MSSSFNCVRLLDAGVILLILNSGCAGRTAKCLPTPLVQLGHVPRLEQIPSQPLTSGEVLRIRELIDRLQQVENVERESLNDTLDSLAGVA